MLIKIILFTDQVNKEQMEAGRATIKSAQREIAA